MDMVRTNEHEFKVGGHAHDAAQEGEATVARLVEVAQGLAARLNPSDEDHSDHVEEYWQALSQYAYDQHDIEPDT